MALRELLTYAHDDSAFNALSNAAGNGGGGAPERAFVSQSLRPYLVAALADDNRDRPALLVTGDDRAARAPAADLRAVLPRPRPRPRCLFAPPPRAPIPGRGCPLRVQVGPPPAPGGPACGGTRRAGGR